eukprot:3378985-Amphidinium_carterae.1
MRVYRVAMCRGIYVSYLELINLHTDVDNEPMRLLFFCWEALKGFNAAAGESDVTAYSVIGARGHPLLQLKSDGPDAMPQT